MNPQPRPSRVRALWFTIGLAAVLRLVLVVPLIHSRAFSWNSGGELSSIAAAITRGEGFASPYGIPTGPTAQSAPIYPYLLAGTLALVPTSREAATIAVSSNVAWSALVCVPLWALAERLRPRLGLLAAGVWAVTPLTGYSEVIYFWSTSLYTLALVTLMWATLRLDEELHTRAWVMYGLLAGLTLLLDPAHSFAWPVALVSVAAVRRWRWSRVLIVLLVATVTILPWCVRNTLAFRRPMYLRGNTGYELYRGLVSDPFDSGTAVTTNPGRSPQELRRYVSLGEDAYMSERSHEVWGLLRTRSVASTVGRTARRVWVYWTGDISVRWLYRPAGRLVWFKYACFMLVSLFAVCGVAYLAGSHVDRALLVFAVSFLALLPLPYYVALTSPRYRAPLEPLCYLLIVVAVARWRDSRAARVAVAATSA